MRALYLDPGLEPAKFVPVDVGCERCNLEELIGGEINIVPLSGRLAAVVHAKADDEDFDLPYAVVVAGPSGKIRRLRGPVVLVRRNGEKLLPITRADELEYGGCHRMLTEAYA